MPAGGVAAYEVWNEEDETQFWGATPNPAQYAAILKAAYPAIKSADPQAKVLLGPLTGNNYDFLSALYANGAQGSFDAASVHTDTACLVDQPDSFYREEGNVARFTFLGFRSVHDVMAAHGDGDKPIWMTELGWTTTTSTCSRGMWAGKKAAGVSEAQQAANLREAYHCLAGYPYVEAGMWFTIKDLNTGTDELDHYGLARRDNSPQGLAGTRSTASPPRATTLPGRAATSTRRDIRIGQPTANAQFIEALRIQAKATDADAGRAHDLPGRRQGDPQLHRRRRRLRQARHARLAGLQAAVLRPAQDHGRRARPPGQHLRAVGHGHARQDARGHAEDDRQAGQGQGRQGPQGRALRARR